MKRSTITSLFLSGCLVGSVLVGGCAGMNTVERAEPTGQKQMVSDKRVIANPILNSRVNIVGINESTTASGYLQVQIEVQNRTRSLQNFSYRFEWFDPNGMQISTSSSLYIAKQIEGRESLFFSAVAPTTSAKDFRLKIVDKVPGE
jgi:uncharacterized protein YcfL